MTVQGEATLRETVLFPCAADSCRSRMAERFTNSLLRDRFTAYSAGTACHSAAGNCPVFPGKAFVRFLPETLGKGC